VVQGRAQFSGRSSLKTWWFGVIRFTAREERRRTLVRDKLHLRLLFQAASPAPDPASPARQLEVDEQATLLRTALNRLPQRQAEVLHLVFYQDLSLSAVAEVLGISIGSVRQHYDRGKNRLRELLPSHETISSS
jgi:RNA polymerase sigma-70 factor (ECF subfamily)